MVAASRPSSRRGVVRALVVASFAALGLAAASGGAGATAPIAHVRLARWSVA